VLIDKGAEILACLWTPHGKQWQKKEKNPSPYIAMGQRPRQTAALAATALNAPGQTGSPGLM
jgi:hypothetical protein